MDLNLTWKNSNAKGKALINGIGNSDQKQRYVLRGGQVGFVITLLLETLVRLVAFVPTSYLQEIYTTPNVSYALFAFVFGLQGRAPYYILFFY